MASTCPICLDNLDLDGKVKASPDACEHVFCLPCLEKWSKLGSYCPVDRKRYKKIVNLESESVIQIKPRKRKRKRIVYDFSTTCEICVKDDYPDTLLLCDCCDLGFHCHCLTPPLETVPAGLWFCPTCVTVEEKLKQKKGITKEMELDYDVFLQKINYYQPVLPETKKQKISTPVKSEGVQDTFNDIISVFEDINVVPDEDRNIKTELNDISDAETISINVCDVTVKSPEDDVSQKWFSITLASSTEISIRENTALEEKLGFGTTIPKKLNTARKQYVSISKRIAADLVKLPSFILKTYVKTTLETDAEDLFNITAKPYVSISKRISNDLIKQPTTVSPKFIKSPLETSTEDQFSGTRKPYISITGRTAEGLGKLPIESSHDEELNMTGKQYACDIKKLLIK